MRISEIFDSIQGEGVHAGEPMTFIRLAGCNLHCIWCDTKYAQNSEEAKVITPQDVRAQVRRRRSCITGGEPLVQETSLKALLSGLEVDGVFTEVETNGSRPYPGWGHKFPDSWVVDIKMPSSGNPSDQEIIKDWSDRLSDRDQIKMVVSGPEDLAEAEKWLGIIKRTIARVIISPVLPLPQDRPKLMEEVAKFCMDHDLRLSIQVHKVVWGNARGK
jgi:7-carboxy-7-deazaguanine synthase